MIVSPWFLGVVLCWASSIAIDGATASADDVTLTVTRTYSPSDKYGRGRSLVAMTLRCDSVRTQENSIKTLIILTIKKNNKIIASVDSWWTLVIDTDVDVENTLGGAAVSGQLEPKGTSFLEYKWSSPSDEIAGTYTCKARASWVSEQTDEVTILENESIIENVRSSSMSDVGYTVAKDYRQDDAVIKSLTLTCTSVRQEDTDINRLDHLKLSSDGVLRGHMNYYKPTKPIEEYDLGAEVSGHLDPEGSSFLQYKWSYPTEEIAGEYKCSAHGKTCQDCGFDDISRNATVNISL